MVHIGKKIRKIVYDSRIPVSELAFKINKSRTVVYDIFERESIDTALLYQISKALDHNFFNYYLLADNKAEEPQEKYYTAGEVKKMEQELEHCKRDKFAAEKEVQYLKKINALLEKKGKK